MQKISKALASPLGAALILGFLGVAALRAFGAFADAATHSGDRITPFFALLSAALGAGLFWLIWRENRQGGAEVRQDLNQLPMSFFDAMTGIPNQLHFQDKVSAALLSGADGAVLVIDLADVSGVNDRRGRAFGDVVIKETGRRLRDWAEETGSLAARLDGDRFGLYLPKAMASELPGICEDLAGICAEPVIKGGDMVEPKVALGAVALITLGPMRAHGFDTVMSICRFALTRARNDAQAAYCIYSEALENEFVDLDAMAVDLPEAMRSGALEVFLQPRVSLSTGELFGFEALMRWKRGGKYVATEDLITMAEANGLIFDLDRYMINRTIQTMADWNRRRKTAYPVSVNLSALHLRADKGVEFIVECLNRHRLPPDLLTIEVTETANLAVLHHLKGVAALREAGCRIAIDDFGTGYASLARLRVLPADEIKIDRLLVSEIAESEEARFILESVLRLAESLDMLVVAEGIENEGQAQTLIEMGCHYGQGYMFGKPRPALDWLADATYGEAEKWPAQ
ncbi:MAG: phosphodiesterase [Silicimonas sp.]|nr:phosphodiesterase [Silicimonas sp.]